MTNSLRFTFTAELEGTTGRFAADFTHYVHAPHVMALTLLEDMAKADENGEYGDAEYDFYDVVTVNPPAGQPLFLLNPDTDLIISHNMVGTPIPEMLAAAGIIHNQPYTQVRTGMALNPVYALTDEMIAWLEEHADSEDAEEDADA